jgi:hypothetical protein
MANNLAIVLLSINRRLNGDTEKGAATESRNLAQSLVQGDSHGVLLVDSASETKHSRYMNFPPPVFPILFFQFVAEKFPVRLADLQTRLTDFFTLSLKIHVSSVTREVHTFYSKR